MISPHFCRPLRLAGITVELFLPASTRGKHRINAHRTQRSMPPVGFEPTISVLERAKTVRALDGAVTAIGNVRELRIRMSLCCLFSGPIPQPPLFPLLMFQY
jgi:hypothetical protein